MIKINRKSLTIVSAFVLIMVFIGSNLSTEKVVLAEESKSWWQVQSIDTMKHSRDLAREKLRDNSFDKTIEEQIKRIAEAGATHVAIGTPYDEEFIPILERWVRYARANKMNVWFRGNFSGWEEWFDYEGISRQEHLVLLEEFIIKNPHLFEDGDLFSTCPECENGGPGDPRFTGDAKGHTEFLIEEYEVATSLFNQIGKNVDARYFSMNGDVAELIMDKETTRALGGLVVVDHYVRTPEQLAGDVKKYAEQSGGKVVLGEFGAPIPDIHGDLSEEEQAAWLSKALTLLSEEEVLVGLNYWVFAGGSTGLWQNDKSRMAATVLADFYKPKETNIKITDPLGRRISNAKINVHHKEFYSDNFGNANILLPPQATKIKITKEGYKSYTQNILNSPNLGNIFLESERENILIKVIAFFRSIITK